MTSCVVRPNKPYSVEAREGSFVSSGFFAESTTYFYDTDSEDEAHYLCAILNSKTIDELIAPLQARGDFGERHIHKTPLTFPIPRFDERIKEHLELAKLGHNCHEKTINIVSNLSVRSTGKIRSIIRERLSKDYEKIDLLTRTIMNSSS